MFEALDDLKPGEVYLCAGGSPSYALWGGLMSTRAIACGAAGAVLHGYHRDTAEILRLGFPVASFGSYAQDQGPRGKVGGLARARSRWTACAWRRATSCTATATAC